MAEYNGHKNWTHWNVSLWIGNDEGIYRRARNLIAAYGRDKAARMLLGELPDKTPDGARYSYSAVRAALVGI